MNDRDVLNLIAKIARDTRRDLSSRASEGTGARPTVKQLNDALDQLDRIANLAAASVALKLSDVS